MKTQNILIIGASRHLTLPSNGEIEKSFSRSRVISSDTIKECLDTINGGEYSILVICGTLNESDRKKLEIAINHLRHKPAVIAINTECKRQTAVSRAVDEASIYIPADENLRKNLLCAIDVALKMHRLTMKIDDLNERLEKAKTDHNIVDLTLAYNHEINNLLTTIIGNTQLMLKLSSDLDINIVKKLEKIGNDAYRIQEMAIGLIDIINAPADSMPLSEF